MLGINRKHHHRLHIFSVPLITLFLFLGSSPATAIVGGVEVPASGEMARKIHLLERRLPGGVSGYCTASLLRDDIIITAGHCIEPNIKGGKYFIVFTLYNNNKLNINISKFILHEYQDLAIAKLERNAPSGTVKLMMPNDYEENIIQRKIGGTTSLSNETIISAGYGANNIDSRSKNRNGRILRTKSSRITFWRTYDNKLYVEAGPCSGDSGSPGLITIEGRELIIGVYIESLKKKNSTDECTMDSLYVYIPHYRKWIEKSIQQLDSKIK